MTDKNTMTTHKAAQAHEAPVPHDLETHDAPPAPAPVMVPSGTPTSICGVQAFGRGGLCVLFADASIWFTDDFGGSWKLLLPIPPAGDQSKKK